MAISLGSAWLSNLWVPWADYSSGFVLRLRPVVCCAERGVSLLELCRDAEGGFGFVEGKQYFL
jgi:hypothetical protein